MPASPRPNTLQAISTPTDRTQQSLIVEAPPSLRPGSRVASVLLLLMGLIGAPFADGTVPAAFAADAEGKPAADKSSAAGQRVYLEKCARCHGEKGEGTPKHSSPLVGEKSLVQLTGVIARTMPEDDPGSLTAEETKTVSEFVHQQFYSAIARERQRPARVELARLTVRQYRQTVADLVTGLRGEPVWNQQRGLKGEYYKGRHFHDGERVAERIDPQVNFRFGTGAPVEKIEEPRTFSIRWMGELLAPETGEYVFQLRTDQAAKLFLNDPQKPLIDGFVKSGSQLEYEERMFLVGGRIYPLRLEFHKGSLVGDDPNQPKQPSRDAEITLSWRRPGGVFEPIPARNLGPGWAPEVTIVSTPFPPDDRSYGWERGNSISKAWDQAATQAGLEVATAVSEAMQRHLPGAPDGLAKWKETCRTLVERGFRRPLGDDAVKLLVDEPFAAAGNDYPLAAKRVLLTTLLSPRFLYRELGGSPASEDLYDRAARMSYALWDSMPDQELINGAREGWLTHEGAVRQQAERMVRNPRAVFKLRNFLLTWLRADGAHDLTKNPEKFADFSPAVIADLRTSLELQLDQVLEADHSDYRQLFLADQVYLNDRLAKFYGVTLSAETPAGQFVATGLNREHRAGVLTHPYLMAMFAHSSESSPIHRGVFLARGVLGQALKTPPIAVAPSPPDLHPDLTTRERVVLQTRPAACMSCHSLINPLGFCLEHFDAVGRYRDRERGKPIDAHGTYLASDGRTIEVDGARALAKFLAESEETADAFAEQLFHHLVQQPTRAYGRDTFRQIKQSFREQQYDIRKLAVEIVVRTATQGRTTESTP